MKEQALIVIILGAILFLHDLLVHTTGRFGINRPVYVKGFRIHHGYIGAFLLVLGLILYFLS